MAPTQTRPRSPVAFRPRAPIPLPAVEDVEHRLLAGRRPSLLAPRPRERRAPQPPARLIRMRQRLLTLPVIVAITVRLGWRRVPSSAAGQSLVAPAGGLGSAPRPGRPQALMKRRDVRPAAGLGQLLGEVGARWQAPAPPAWPPPRWAPGREPCARIALVDGSTREALRQKPQGWREHAGLGLGGKRRVMVEALSQRPWGPWSTDDAAAQDQRGVAEMLAALPVGGRRVCARGCCRGLGGDDCTASDRVLVTHMRQKTA